MTAARRHPSDDIVLIPRLAEADACLVIAALERMAIEYDRSAAELPPAFTGLAIRDKDSADRCRRLAERLGRMRHAMRHRS